MKKYQEYKINNLKKLKELIYTLDLDEGIRIRADENKTKYYFIFITKLDDVFTINLTSKKIDEHGSIIPGNQNLWFTNTDPNNVINIINSKMKLPIEAWSY